MHIHEDQQLPISEKCQFLVQSITKGSKACGVVSSYPQTDHNYNKLIETLKKRFGREDMLVEVYVCELLKLVINNNLHSKSKGLSVMFDTLESYLRSLETLGVTSLPDEILQAWQRSYQFNNPNQDKLNNLMKFLEAEVKSEERIKLARDGFLHRS